MAKSSRQRSVRMAAMARVLVIVEFALLLLYRLAYMPWLIYLIVGNIAILAVIAIVAYPKILGGVFSAIFVTFLVSTVTCVVPLFALMQSSWEPGAMTGLVVGVVWLVGNIVGLALVYGRAEKYFLKDIKL